MAMRLELLIITMLCITGVAGGKGFYSQKRTVPPSSYTGHQISPPPGELGTPYLAANSSLKNGVGLVSEDGTFTLGFFSFGTNAYLGIWYTSSEDVVVWVANRDDPIPVLVDCSLVLGDNGTAMVMDSYSRIYWSTGSSSNHPKNNTYLIILDNGNLVLTNQTNYVPGKSLKLWQSFDHPTDTFLYGMGDVNITSWKSHVDPSSGNYMLQVQEGQGKGELLSRNSSSSSVVSLPSPVVGKMVQKRMVMNATGSAQIWEHLDDDKSWVMIWWGPKDECDSYEGCGSNGVCNAGRCKCLPGHHPADPDKWSLGDDFFSGCLPGTIDQYKTNDIEDIDIPFIEYQSILAATNNFSDANKLGVGGFGPVYKGVLVDGNEVAVKRLSKASMQGVQEFKNEIVLIAKLQHRNLVRVIGYCISKGEKILIYEYMPNKSLDSFLFNQTTQPLLDWMKRFDIILGIARGLLYLHQDSRLRIVHRDLKPANILLDEELNPKISDFGLAKIIAGNDMPTNTTRVVGTYGYISPEYALEGYFSIKSDVYSFGIIVFEIISGRRCTSLQPFDNAVISLLGYAWALWMQGKVLELVHKSITSTCNNLEVQRCITVALLCTQEDPSERPTMSDVLLMLSGDNMNLPYPKQPVFIARRHPTLSSASNAELTITIGAR